MIGAVLIVLVLVIAGPVALFVGGAVWSALVGTVASTDADQRYEDSEYVAQKLW